MLVGRHDVGAARILTSRAGSNLTRGGTSFTERSSVDKCRSLLCLVTSFQGDEQPQGEDAKGVSRSGFPSARRLVLWLLKVSLVEAGACPPWRACSRDLIRVLAGALPCLKRCDSLPVWTMWQRCVSRSNKAALIFASPNTLGHASKLRLLVIITG